jgi:hypothetical protein
LLILTLLLKPVVGAAARRSLVGRLRSQAGSAGGRFSRSDVRRILARTWVLYEKRLPDLPREPTIGSRINVSLACLTVSVFHALLEEGVEREYAIELVGDATWVIYEKWALVPDRIARMRTRDPVRRMRICVDSFLRFPFNPPGYRIERHPDRRGAAFDVLRCPVAEYFAAHDASDLCVGTWCDLDYALAEAWGGHLDRGSTISRGAPCCDFRFHAGGAQRKPSARTRTVN